MAKQDSDGRAYAKLSELKEGDVIEVDGGFDCMKEGDQLFVEQRKDGTLFVRCSSEGGHSLAGQNDGDGYLVGMYKV